MQKVNRLSFRIQAKLQELSNWNTEVSCSLLKNFLSGSVFSTTKSVWLRTSVNIKGTINLKRKEARKSDSLSIEAIDTACRLPPPTTRLTNLFARHVLKSHDDSEM